jgi:endoribonuclease LACTB2
LSFKQNGVIYPSDYLQFTLQGTNTYLLGTGPSRILIDTGDGTKQWIEIVRKILTSSTPPISISACLLTHWHHDHLGGVRDLESLHSELSPSSSLKVHKNQPSFQPDNLINPETVHDIADGQKFSVGNDFEIQAIHTPGHAKDHMVFQVTHSDDPSEIGAMFTADNVLGHGTAVFEDLMQYLNSIKLMKSRVVDAISARGGESATKRAYPGHGQYIDDAVSKFDEYIAHRRMREEEALNVLRYGTVKGPNTATHTDSLTRAGNSEDDLTSAPKEVVAGKEWESMEMVKVIYRHYPENLWEPAERGLLMVLEKLKGDGVVSKTEGGRWKVAREKSTL